jgi:hypothetical protein
MSTTVYNQSGTDPATELIRMEGPIVGDRIENRWTFKVKYWCNADVAIDTPYGEAPYVFGVIPVYGDIQTIYGIEYAVTDVVVSASEDTTIAYVDITYSLYHPYINGTDTATRTAVVITLDISVEDQRLYNPSYSYYGDMADKAKEDGQTQVAIGGIRYRYSDHLDGLIWTEANIVDAFGIGPGYVGTPTGMSNTTDGLWMFRGKTVNELPRGAGIDVIEEWEYSPIGWPGEYTATTTTTTTTTSA